MLMAGFEEILWQSKSNRNPHSGHYWLTFYLAWLPPVQSLDQSIASSSQ